MGCGRRRAERRSTCGVPAAEVTCSASGTESTRRDDEGEGTGAAAGGSAEDPAYGGLLGVAESAAARSGIAASGSSPCQLPSLFSVCRPVRWLEPVRLKFFGWVGGFDVF